MSRNIVIVSGSRALTRQATRTLVSAGCSVQRCPAEKAALEPYLTATPPDMFLIDADGDEEPIKWLVEELVARKSDAIPLILSNDLKNGFLFELLAQRGLNNLVARHGGLSATHEVIDEYELIVTCHKLFQRDIFGLEKYLPAFGIKIHEHQVMGSAERGDSLAALERFLNDIDCYGAIIPAISLVADELLTNAIYNAPRDAQGRPKYATWDRREPVRLDANEAVQFRFACDGRYVALSVTDNFGSLDRDVIVRYLEHTFRGVHAQIEQKEGGAGIGLYMVLNSITQLTFNIEAHKRTEVIALFYIRSGARAFKSSGRSLNIFLLQ